MYNIKDFIKDIDRINSSMGHEKKWEKLRDRIFRCAVLTDDEILQLDRDVIEFLESDATEEEKRNLMEYTESLAIIIDGIMTRRGRYGEE